MFGSEEIDVGIGMALLFLFMSVIASALREVIENISKSRAKDLELGIKELLQECSNEGKTKEFYNHPLIASLYKGEYISGNKKLPSYIPRQSFSLALLDIVAGASTAGTALSVESLRTSLTGAGNPNAIQRVVQTAIDTAEGDLDRVRTTIEDWYDGAMDRVSGWYTRRTGRILGIIGFLGAVFFNVDAITVAKSLIRDKSLRQAVVAQAEHYVPSEPAGAVPKPPGAPDASEPPDAGQDKPVDPSGSESPEAGKALKELNKLKSELDEIGFPIGWKWTGWWPYPTPQTCGWPVKLTTPPTGPPETVSSCQVTPWSWVLPFCGWIITALAIMLGAPFWFDVLSKFMVIRSTVKPKEKGPDEAPAGRQSAAVRPATDLAPDAGDAGQLTAATALAALAVRDDAFEPHEWANDPNPQRGVM